MIIVAGHSKWANIRRHKGVQDKKKAHLSTKLAREIMVAVQLHGKDLQSNPRLRDSIALAKSHNISKDTIQRAILKGAGESGSKASYEEITYEGYGINGAAVLVECTTDNRNRTVAAIRNIFSKNKGNLGENGCVTWIFKKKGFIELKRDDQNEEELFQDAIDLGALDIEESKDRIELSCEVNKLSHLREELEKKGYSIIQFDIIAEASTNVELNQEDSEAMIKLIDALEEHEDVQRVHSNANFPEPDA